MVALAGQANAQQQKIPSFRTPDEGMVGLGFFPGNGEFSSYARGISADGSVIVGGSSSDEASNAFRWTESTGVVALTPDGSTIVGWGLNSAGGWHNEAFLIRLTIPTPTTLAPLALAGLLATRRRRA